MKKLADLIEKYLIRSIIFTLITLALVQGIMTKDPIRFYLSFSERLEGQTIEYPVNTIDSDSEDLALPVENPYALVTITIDKYSSLPNSKVIVNGKEITTFTEKEIQLKIMAGDVVEIDSTAYNFPVDYKITKVSDNLSFPEQGNTYTANGSLVMIGKVIVK